MPKIVHSLLVAVASLAASAQAADRSHPGWMVGQWAWVSPTEMLRRNDCPESEFYGRNGYVVDGESVSSWRIEGDYLIRVMVEPGYGELIPETRRIYRQRFTRIGRNKLVFKAGGYVQLLIRCGKVPPEWQYLPKR